MDPGGGQVDRHNPPNRRPGWFPALKTARTQPPPWVPPRTFCHHEFRSVAGPVGPVRGLPGLRRRRLHGRRIATRGDPPGGTGRHPPARLRYSSTPKKADTNGRWRIYHYVGELIMCDSRGTPASREDTWAKVAHWIEQPELIRNATHPAKVWTFYNSFFVAVTAASTIGQLPLFVVRWRHLHSPPLEIRGWCWIETSQHLPSQTKALHITDVAAVLLDLDHRVSGLCGVSPSSHRLPAEQNSGSVRAACILDRLEVRTIGLPQRPVSLFPFFSTNQRNDSPRAVLLPRPFFSPPPSS